jgi:hypothetical protein
MHLRFVKRVACLPLSINEFQINAALRTLDIELSAGTKIKAS